MNKKEVTNILKYLGRELVERATANEISSGDVSHLKEFIFKNVPHINSVEFNKEFDPITKPSIRIYTFNDFEGNILKSYVDNRCKKIKDIGNIILDIIDNKLLKVVTVRALVPVRYIDMFDKEADGFAKITEITVMRSKISQDELLKKFTIMGEFLLNMQNKLSDKVLRKYSYLEENDTVLEIENKIKELFPSVKQDNYEERIEVFKRSTIKGDNPQLLYNKISFSIPKQFTYSNKESSKNKIVDLSSDLSKLIREKNAKIQIEIGVFEDYIDLKAKEFIDYPIHLFCVAHKMVKLNKGEIIEVPINTLTLRKVQEKIEESKLNFIKSGDIYDISSTLRDLEDTQISKKDSLKIKYAIENAFLTLSKLANLEDLSN